MGRRSTAKNTRVNRTLGRIAKIGARVGTPPARIALALVAQRRKKIERVLKRRGIKPAVKTGNLAIQAAQVMEQDAIGKAMEMGLAPTPEELTPEQIEMGFDEVQEDEEIGIENDPENEADSFDPATIGAVFGAVKGAVTRVNSNRAEKGKPPILRGKKWTARQKAAAADLAKGIIPGKSAATVLKEVAGEAIEGRKMQEINRMLPMILIGVAVIFFIGKKS